VGHNLNFIKSGSYGIIALSLFIGVLLNIIPWGNTAWVPDFTLLVLTFWVAQAPEKIGLTFAFFLGLLMDVQTSQYLGIHAISYVVTCFFILFWNRRLLNNTLIGQTFVVLQIFLIASAIQMLILFSMGATREFSFSYFFLPPLMQAVLWPILKKLLSSPQQALNRNIS
jgi:rod shape-determining protein MreD